MGKLTLYCIILSFTLQCCNINNTNIQGNWMYIEPDTSFVEVFITKDSFLYYHEFNSFSKKRQYIIEDNNKVVFPNKNIEQQKWFQGKVYFINDSIFIFDNIVQNTVFHRITDSDLKINDKNFNIEKYNNILPKRKVNLLVTKGIIDTKDVNNYIDNNSYNQMDIIIEQ